MTGLTEGTELGVEGRACGLVWLWDNWAQAAIGMKRPANRIEDVL